MPLFLPRPSSDAVVARPADAASRPSPLRRRGGTLLAAGLLVAAVVFALGGVDLSALTRRLAAAGPGPPVALAALVVLNLLVTAGLTFSLVGCFRVNPPVTAGRMLRLITASQLLNYLPLIWAGLLGRAAYLKKHHDLRLRDSGYITLITAALTTAVIALASTGPLLIVTTRAHPRWAWGGSVLALAVLTLAVASAGRRLAVTGSRTWLWVTLRTIDLAAAAGRVAIAFAAVGHPVTAEQAVLLAGGTTLTKLVGLTPNGLGLSEWVIAGLATALSPVSAPLAAAAALLDRTVEVGVSGVAGGWGLWGLRRGGEREE